MRRVLLMLILCVVAMPYVGAKGNSSKKTVKSIVSGYEKEGYTPYGSYSMFTLDELVTRSRDKVMGDMERFIPIEGIGEGNDLSSAKMFALNNASIQYATASGSKLSGEMATQFSNLTEETRTKIVGLYTQKVSEFVMPTLSENYIIGKKEGSKMVIRANYMIDEVKAKASRENAMDFAVQQVAKEVALEQAFLDSVNGLVSAQPVE